MSMKTASIIVVSDEVLQSKKCDHSSQFLVNELTCLGYLIGKISVVNDRENVIYNEFNTLLNTFDIIIAVGDKPGTIYKALGTMISQELHNSKELIVMLSEIGETYENDEVLLPSQAKILSSGDVYPVVYFQRIFILKERHLKECFNKIMKSHLIQYRKNRKLQKTIEVSKNGSFVDFDEITKTFNESLQVELRKSDKSYIFQVSGSELDAMVEFQQKISTTFPNYNLNFVDNSDVWENVYSSNEKHVKIAIENIEQCLEQHGLDNIFVSFNGGKDCTVLLHLVLTVVNKKYPHYKEPVLCLYVQSESPFPEQDEFISQCQIYYNLKIMTIRSGIKEALQQTLEKYPNYKACFMGTRRTDPYSSDLNVFQMTDPNWPQILRVSPLLDWHYSDIWDYLLFYKVPYCKLYDMGFTSLGNTINTKRNPSLIYSDPCTGSETYLPAYKLLKEVKERNGRNSS